MTTSTAAAGAPQTAQAPEPAVSLVETVLREVSNQYATFEEVSPFHVIQKIRKTLKARATPAGPAAPAATTHNAGNGAPVAEPCKLCGGSGWSSPWLPCVCESGSRVAREAGEAGAPVSPAPSDARALAAVREALQDYYLALDRRQHGGIAQSDAISRIEHAVGMLWVRGAALSAHEASTASPTDSSGQPVSGVAG